MVGQICKFQLELARPNDETRSEKVGVQGIKRGHAGGQAEQLGGTRSAIFFPWGSKGFEVNVKPQDSLQFRKFPFRAVNIKQLTSKFLKKQQLLDLTKYICPRSTVRRRSGLVVE